MRTLTLISILALVFAFLSCQRSKNTGDLVIQFSEVLDWKDIYASKEYSSFGKSENWNKKIANSAEESNSPFDTSELKSYSFEISHYLEKEEPLILSKIILDVDFGKVKIDSLEYWFPYTCKNTAFSKITDIDFLIGSHFSAYEINEGELMIFLTGSAQYERYGSFSEKLKNGILLKDKSHGGISADAFDAYWVNGKDDFVLSDYGILTDGVDSASYAFHKEVLGSIYKTEERVFREIKLLEE